MVRGKMVERRHLLIFVCQSHTFGQVIVGMSLAGAGAGIGELTALSGVGELVPVKKRGLYTGLVRMMECESSTLRPMRMDLEHTLT